MKIFSEIPTEIPVTTVLNKIHVPADIKNLSSIELKTLADDVRAHMLYSRWSKRRSSWWWPGRCRTNSCITVFIQYS